MRHMAGLGTFQFNHLFICTLDSAETKERLASHKELTVKERRWVNVDTPTKGM